MPSNNLALGLYELSISKRTFLLPTGFCLFREGEGRRLSIGDNFLQQLRRSGVSRVGGEKVAAARTEKLGTHTLTHSLTHTHTGRLLYPRYSPAAARVTTITVGVTADSAVTPTVIVALFDSEFVLNLSTIYA